MAGTKPAQPHAKQAASAEAKKETSKIPLESAKPAEGAKTPGMVTAAKKTDTSPLDGASPEVVEAKSKTSRISLDSVLAADSEDKPKESSGAPKTIKLKRPSEAVTVKAKKPAPAAGKDLSKTAPLDEAADSQAAGTSTGRPTVKVRKPTMKIKKAGGPAAGGAAPAAAGAAQAGVAGAAAPEPYVDSAHWVFVTFGILSFLVISVMIWMFTAQVIGPNYSLTKASYYPEGYDLAWPHKLRKMPGRN